MPPSSEAGLLWPPSLLLRLLDLVSSLIQRCPKKVITAAVTVMPRSLGPHLSTAANAAIVAAEGDTLVLDDDVPQVLVGFANVHAFDGLGRLTGVLKVRTQTGQRPDQQSGTFMS